MSIRLLVWRILWKTMSYFGPRAARLSWNEQFKRGRWDCLRDGRREKVVELVEEHARGGAIVELACGEGLLISAIRPDVYDSYLGIDIADIALQSAVENTRKQDLRGCRFEQMNIADWPGGSNISLIILEECLYYLNAEQQSQILRTCLDSLSSDGAVIVTFHLRSRHGDTIDNCKQICPSADDISDGEHAYLILRPAPTLATV